MAASLVGQQNVGRLHIAMNDAPAVDVGEGFRHIRADCCDGRGRQRSPQQPGAQILAINEFEDEVGATATAVHTFRDCVEQGYQSRSVEGGEKLDLIALPANIIGGRQISAEHLQCDRSTERFVQRTINGRHSAGAEHRFDPEAFPQQNAGADVRVR